MPPDPPSRHTFLHVRERAFARYYHPATMLFPPQLKILYATLILPSSQVTSGVFQRMFMCNSCMVSTLQADCCLATKPKVQ